MPRDRPHFYSLCIHLRWEWRLLKHEWRSPTTSVRNYWKAYGGFGALLRSPYLHIAVFIGILCVPWASTGGDWASKILTVIPNLLGFSLSGFAILLALGSEKFQGVLARAGGTGKSVLINISTSFVHFIIVQATTLLFAIAADGIWPLLKPALKSISSNEWKFVSASICGISGFIGCTMLAYSITSLIAATFRVYRLVGNFVKMVQLDAKTAKGAEKKKRSE